MSDPIQKINEDALQNMQWEKMATITSNFKIYGDYSYVPIEDERKQGIQKALDHINDLCRPTVKALRYKSNKQELQERIYRRLGTFESEFNHCIANSNNMKDSNYCADKFIKQLSNDAVLFVKETLRDY